MILETARQRHPQLLIVYCTRNWQYRGKGFGITKQSGDQPRATEGHSVQTPQLYTRMYTHAHRNTLNTHEPDAPGPRTAACTPTPDMARHCREAQPTTPEKKKD